MTSPAQTDRLKRLIDVVVSAGMLVVAAPVLLVLAGMVRWKLGSPVLFRQQRPGLGGRPFVLYKFRTMTAANDRSGRPLPDDLRLTPFGRSLRATSLDELPELWNVLRGDMSLVGPRPLLMEYLDHYSVEQARRHEVRPGITGLAQISGRNSLAWEDRLELDVIYVNQRSLMLDVQIMLRTMHAIISGHGIEAPGYVTSPRLDEKGQTREGGDGLGGDLPR